MNFTNFYGGTFYGLSVALVVQPSASSTEVFVTDSLYIIDISVCDVQKACDLPFIYYCKYFLFSVYG